MRSPSFVFTRRIHILHELFTSTPKGRVAKLETNALPPLVNDVRLLDKQGNTIATVCSMDGLLSHLEPFSYLERVSSAKPLYRIVQLMKFSASRKGPGKFKRVGTGKELHITTTSLASTCKHTVSKAYEFLSKGWRVEFHVRSKTDNKAHSIDWALRYALHMRPEVINAAMPEGTKMLMPPVLRGSELLWVLDHEKNRLKAGYSRRAPTQSEMPIDTGITKAATAGKQIIQPNDQRSLISKRSRESAPKKEISLPGPENSDEIPSTQVHHLPAGGGMNNSDQGSSGVARTERMERLVWRSGRLERRASRSDSNYKGGGYFGPSE